MIEFNADLIGLSLCVGLASITLTRTQLTKRFRHAIIDWPFMLGDLASCPYCLAHWLGFMSAFLLQPSLGISYVINAGVIIALACLYIGVVMRLWYSQETELEDMRDLLKEAMSELEGRLTEQDAQNYKARQ